MHKDPLSSLNSDIIDHIGAFLTKKASIEFGYVNKQLYIETRKLSYILAVRRSIKVFLHLSSDATTLMDIYENHIISLVEVIQMS